jgi:uncharacterized protein
LREIEAFARERFQGREAAHDVAHIERVVANARRLLTDERSLGHDADEFVIRAACWLHDSVQLPKGQGPPGESARRSAACARALLTDLGVPRADIDAIAHAVEAHSFSGGLRPDTVEAAIVQDADRLDALGAVGIARFWVTAAGIGRSLYDADDPRALRRPLDDREFALDHIEKKLLRLPELMNTVAGRAEAERRAQFLREYRERFLDEIGWLGTTGEDASPLADAIAAGELDAELLYPSAPTPTVPAAAAALGVAEDQILKTLVFVARDGSVVLAIASGTSRVSRRRLSEVTGLSGLQLAAPNVVLERTGYKAGGVPPVCHRSRLTTVVDRRVAEAAVLFGGGGSDRAMLRIQPAEIIRVTGATVADIVE